MNVAPVPATTHKAISAFRHGPAIAFGAMPGGAVFDVALIAACSPVC
jgi:hypothetical protein